MTKRKTTTKPAEIRNTAAARKKALAELGINKPFYTCRVVGGRLEFALYGGELVTWPPNVGAVHPELGNEPLAEGREPPNVGAEHPKLGNEPLAEGREPPKEA